MHLCYHRFHSSDYIVGNESSSIRDRDSDGDSVFNSANNDNDSGSVYNSREHGDTNDEYDAGLEAFCTDISLSALFPIPYRENPALFL